MAILSRSAKVNQYILFCLNFIFWVCGVVLLAIGIWILVATQSAVLFLQIPNMNFGLLHAAGATLIVAGSLIFLVGGLGCCGACSENVFCLNAFAVILILLIILQIIAIILAGTMHSQLTHEIGKLLTTSLNESYGKPGNEVDTVAWNYLQITLKCCGVGKPADWNGTLWFRNQSSTSPPPVPQSCCIPLSSGLNYTIPVAQFPTACYEAAYNENIFNRTLSVNTQGCEASLDDWIVERAAVLIGVTVAVIIIQVIIVIMACVLKSKLTNAYEYV